MRRVLLAAVVGVVTGVGVAAASASDPPASLQNFVCHRALKPSARYVAVEGVMHARAGEPRMAMRFELFWKTSSNGPWTQVRSGDLGKWKTAPNGLGQNPNDTWEVNKPVSNLYAPATYRFRVSFRWSGGSSPVHTTLQSPTCFEPELRPDLYVKSITVLGAVHHPAGYDRYVTVVGNQGASASGPFQVQFADGSSKPQYAKVQSLRPHSQARLKFVGPSCPPNSVTVTADPFDQVDDSSRANNTLTLNC